MGRGLVANSTLGKLAKLREDSIFDNQEYIFNVGTFPNCVRKKLTVFGSCQKKLSNIDISVTSQVSVRTRPLYGGNKNKMRK